MARVYRGVVENGYLNRKNSEFYNAAREARREKNMDFEREKYMKTFFSPKKVEKKSNFFTQKNKFYMI